MANDNVHLLSALVSDAATLSGGSWRAGAPLTNLQTNDVQEVARSTSAAEAHTQFRLDGGASPPRSWSMVALINHTGSSAATWRVVVTNSATDVVGDRLYDTGAIALWEPSLPFGSLPWGVFPWDGIDTSNDPGLSMALHVMPQSVIGRYVFIYITDTTNPAGHIDIGRLIAGEAWVPKTNVAYGLGIRWVDPSEARRTEGGRRVVRPRAKYRVAEMDFPWLTPDEAWGPVFDLQKLGRDAHVLFIANPQDAPSRRARRSFYAALSDPSAITETAFEELGTRIVLEEII